MFPFEILLLFRKIVRNFKGNLFLVGNTILTYEISFAFQLYVTEDGNPESTETTYFVRILSDPRQTA